MATLTALAKIYSTEYFCNIKVHVTGLGEIFVQRKFLRIWYFSFTCIVTCMFHSGTKVYLKIGQSFCQSGQAMSTGLGVNSNWLPTLSSVVSTNSNIVGKFLYCKHCKKKH